MKYILDSIINCQDQPPSVTPTVTPMTPTVPKPIGEFEIEENITDEYIVKPSNAFEIEESIEDDPKTSDEFEIEDIQSCAY